MGNLCSSPKSVEKPVFSFKSKRPLRALVDTCTCCELMANTPEIEKAHHTKENRFHIEDLAYMRRNEVSCTDMAENSRSKTDGSGYMDMSFPGDDAAKSKQSKMLSGSMSAMAEELAEEVHKVVKSKTLRHGSTSSSSSEKSILSRISVPPSLIRGHPEKLDGKFKHRASSEKKSKKSKPTSLRIKTVKSDGSPIKMMKKVSQDLRRGKNKGNNVTGVNDRDSAAIILCDDDDHYVMMELCPSSKRNKSKPKRK